MSTHRNCLHCGTSAPIRVLIGDTSTTFTLNVGILMSEDIAPADLSIHLAPNHQEYTPNHRKQRRGKFKRSGK